jgi:hypothetical protein
MIEEEAQRVGKTWRQVKATAGNRVCWHCFMESKRKLSDLTAPHGKHAEMDTDPLPQMSNGWQIHTTELRTRSDIRDLNPM